jgi:hypothetical protein
MALIQIGYNNLLALGTLSASSEASADFSKEHAVDYGTWSSWKPNSGTSHYLRSDMGSATPADFAAVYGLRLTGSQTVAIQSSPDAATWTTRASAGASVCTGGAVWLPFASVSARYWQILISDGSAFQPVVAVAMIGVQLLTEMGTHVGLSPFHLSREVDALNIGSEGGALLGRAVLNRGYKWSFSLEHLSPTWVDTYWLPFVLHAEAKPFFLCWPPVTAAPAASMFAWAEGQIPKPSNHHPLYMSASIGGRGLR